MKNVWKVERRSPADARVGRRETPVPGAKKPRAGLSVKLLGGFETRLATGAPVTLPTRKAQALLAYLAVRPGHAHPRDKLAALLWADRGDTQARDSLRHTLVELRKVLPDRSPSLIGEGRAITLDPAAVDVDVVRFEALVTERTATGLAAAADLYEGDFLEGFGLREPAFEEWAVVERERLRERALDVMRRLLEHQDAAHTIEPAIRTALRLLALDATHEAAHRALMRLYVQQGRRAAALRQYQTCVSVLQRELGTEPEAATRQLYQDIVQRRDERTMARPTSSKSLSGRAARRGAPVRAEAVSGEPPLIGRATEVQTLHHALDEAKRGRGRVVTILGEAGVGKSRLVAELAREAADSDTRVLLGRSHESEQILPFGPWVDALRAGQAVPDDPALLALEPAWRAELARLFPEIGTAGLPAPGDDARGLFESVTRLARSLAASQTVLLALEDVHWADDMTLRLLASLGRRIAADRVLVVATAREEELPDAAALRRALGELRGESHVTEIVLSPLSRPDTSALVRSLTGAGTASQTLAQVEEQAWAASEGNPFVVLETVRALREGLTLQDPASLTVPQRVRDVIAARVERLSEGSRQLLSVAAVIGREFDFTLLQRASGLPDRAAAAGVEELVRRRMLHGVGEGFAFTHDRIRETVYASLLPPRRKLLHGDVAAALDALTAGTLDPPAAALGLHYRCAEVWDQAALHLRQAGLMATARSALADARVWLEQALQAVEGLAESPSTREQAFDIRLELRPVLSTLGEPRRTLERLREAESLADRMNDEGRRGRVCAFLTQVHAQLGELDEAILAGRRGLEIAGSLADSRLRILTATNLAQAHFYRADYQRVIELTADNLAHPSPEWVNEYLGMGALPSIWNRHWLAMSLAELGRFADAAPHEAEAIRLAEPTPRVFNSGIAHRTAGTVHLLAGDWAKASASIGQARTAFRAGNVALHLPWAVAASAWVAAHLGETSHALNDLQEGEELIERRATGLIQLYGGDYHALGRASLLLGRLHDARRLGDRAVEFSPGHPGVVARAHHLLGDVATHPERFDAPRGEAHYRQALALAEPHSMRPLVAHCHLGLGNLHGRIGKREQALEHLVTAAAMYRDMGMHFWLEQAEAASRQAGARAARA